MHDSYWIVGPPKFVELADLQDRYTNVQPRDEELVAREQLVGHPLTLDDYESASYPDVFIDC